jgi:hypothetical protein
MKCLAILPVMLGALCAQGAAPATAPATAPDPLLLPDGTRISAPEQWPARRAQLLATFTREMYGQMPPTPPGMSFQRRDNEPGALNGKATRRQVRINLTDTDADKPGHHIDLLLYIPNHARHPVATILAMNFWGNQAVTADPAVLLPNTYIENTMTKYIDLSGIKDHRATDATRGKNAAQWPIDTILDHGYALATFYRCDLDPDVPGLWQQGVRGLYPELHDLPDNFTAMGAWAWGYSRCMDYLQTDPDIDAKRVAIYGWSRLGKAALFAGASDTRLAAVLSQESGAGGAKLFARHIGEDIARLNTAFPHWYCNNFRKYNGKDKELPFDVNELIALCAPRPVFVASSRDDVQFDPEGEFWATKLAEPVYDLLLPKAAPALPADAWPPVSHPVLGQLGYYVRPGHHQVTDEDWRAHLAFLDKHFKPVP